VYGGRIDIGAVEFIPVGLLPGDYNDDGIVDAADYTVWRDNLGGDPLPGPLPEGEGVIGDGNGDGVVDEFDFTVWKSNFGATAAELGAGSTEQGVKTTQAKPPAEPGAVGRESSAASIGESVQQPPALPGVFRRLRNRAPVDVAARQDRVLEAWVAGREFASRQRRTLAEPVAHAEQAGADLVALDCALAEMGELRLACRR
jgi:hypothetical protein